MARLCHFYVQRAKCCSGSGQIFLDSELDYRAPNNLGVIIAQTARTSFSSAGIDDPAAHFRNKTIRVHGVVIPMEKCPSIEVSDSSQIELVSDD